ncbi:MAG: archease [Thermoplasmataceae archaeon]
MQYEIFDHTGDVGLKFFGHSYEELFSSAVAGMAGIMGHQSGRHHLISRKEIISDGGYELILYSILSRVLYYFEAHSELYSSADFPEGIMPGRTPVLLRGYRINSRFVYDYVIKAPTFHELVLRPSEGYGTIVFDI